MPQIPQVGVTPKPPKGGLKQCRNIKSPLGDLGVKKAPLGPTCRQAVM